MLGIDVLLLFYRLGGAIQHFKDKHDATEGWHDGTA